MRKLLKLDVTGDGSAGYMCLAPQCEATFAQLEDLELHARTAHQHVCFWGGADGQCDSGRAGFATREELSWHVKKEHLLVCPVLGCREAPFSSRELVDCHLKWAHGGGEIAKAGQDNGEGVCLPPAGLLKATPSPAPDLAAAANGECNGNERKQRAIELPGIQSLKMQMIISTVKKRCRKQLEMVVEKRARRRNGKLQLHPPFIFLCCGNRS